MRLSTVQSYRIHRDFLSATNLWEQDDGCNEARVMGQLCSCRKSLGFFWVLFFWGFLRREWVFFWFCFSGFLKFSLIRGSHYRFVSLAW